MELNCADAYFNRGYVRSKKGDKRGAITDYNRVIKIDPECAYAYAERGHFRREKGSHCRFSEGNKLLLQRIYVR